MSAFPELSRKTVILAVLLACVAMFAASFRHMLNSGAQEQPRPQATRDAGEGSLAEGAAPQAGMGFGGKEADKLTEMMAMLQQNPNNPEVLREIGRFFMDAEEWQRAQAFLEKALLAKPSDTRPMYLLGICQFRQGDAIAAAKTFENLIQIAPDPSAMFNLALLYKHHLPGNEAAAKAFSMTDDQMRERAALLLRKVVDSPDAGSDLASWAREELATAP